MNFLYISTYFQVMLFSLFGKPVFNNSNSESVNSISSEVSSSKQLFKYGLNLADYRVEEIRIRKNESLSQLMVNKGVDQQMVNELLQKSKGKFSWNKIKAGNTIVFLKPLKAKSASPLKIVYEENAVDFVTFHLGKQLSVTEGKHPVSVKQREVAGIIRGSLYMTFDNLDINPALAVELAEVFSCTVDFYKIQEGDRFKICFEEKYVNGEAAGVGQISSALFQSSGKDYYAFKFDAKGVSGYYDEQGNSMKKQFLKSPVKFARISSRFSKRRFHPVTKVYKAHLGTDYAAAHGTPIHATADGIIEEAKRGHYNGIYVKIRHNGNYKTQYLHMSRIAKGIRRGVRVSQGQTIGYVGSTGLATGPHVCYRFWKDGKQVDPFKNGLKYSEPINKNLRQQFFAQINPEKSTLDKLEYNADPASYLNKKKRERIAKAADNFFEKHF